MTFAQPEQHHTCPRCHHRLPPAQGEPLAFCLNCRFPLLPIAGKYRLVRQLGQGGTGTVYLAQHIHLHRQSERVIKVIPIEEGKDRHIRRFEQEIQVTAMLSQRNEHIVRIYDDFGHAPDLGYYYVMEYLEGKSLRELLFARERLSFVEACHILEQLCQALHLAHGESIIHRDIKPENILVIERDHDPLFVKLIDFGIAHLLHHQSEDGPAQMIVGTPLYMAPEQCLNRTIDARTDLYALGVMLYEMVTGKHPFIDLNALAETNSLSIMFAQVWNPPPALHERYPSLQAPRGLEPLVAKLLAKDPAERIQDAQSLALALQALHESPRTPSFASLPSLHAHRSPTPQQAEISSKISTDPYPAPSSMPLSSPNRDIQYLAVQKSHHAAPLKPHPVTPSATASPQGSAFSPPSEAAAPRTALSDTAESDLLPSAAEMEIDDSSPIVYRTLLSAKLSSLPQQKRERTNLRPPRKSFIGRKQEMEALAAAYAQGERCVTLLGPGGTGKTSLATQYGLHHLADFSGGIWFCDLSETHSLEAMVKLLAQTFEITLHSPQLDEALQQLGYALSCRGEALLIFDNFEQLTAYAQVTLGRWLEEESGLRFLVTSREKLQLQEEHILALPPLPADEAIQLFLERARQHRPRWQPDDAEIGIIRRIVQHLDRLPLAIELAAARMDLLSVDALYARLQERFRILSSPTQDLPARQATLRGAIDWSWDLLSDEEREAFTQCAIFRGGFTLEAAEAILQLPPHAQPIHNLLQALRDKSLLYVMEGDHPVKMLRLGMYESIREYAKERFHQNARRGDVAAMHASYYLALGEALQKGLTQREGLYQLRYLMAESENLQAIYDRYLPHDPNVAMRIMLILQPILERRQTQEAIMQMLGLTLAQTASLRADLYCQGLRIYGDLCRRQGHLVEAEQSLALASRMAQDHRFAGEEAACLLSQGHLLVLQRSTALAQEAFQRALLQMEALGDRHGQAQAHNALGALHRQAGHLREAEADHLKALAFQREQGDQHGEAQTLGQLGHLYRLQGRYHEAIHVYDLALSIHQAWADRHGEAITLNNLGNIHARQGRIKDAQSHYTQALDLHRASGDRRGEAIASGQLGNLKLLRGELHEAEDLQQRASRLHANLHDPKGQAISLNNLGNLYRAQGHFTQALEYYQRAQSLQEAVQDQRGLAFTSLYTALLLVEHQPQAPQIEPLFQIALEEFADRQRQREFHGQTLAAIGLWHREQRRPVEALQAYQQALPCFRQTDARLDAWTRAAIGGLRADLGEVSAAQQVFQYAHESLRQIDDPLGQGFLSLAQAHLDLAYHREALQHQDQEAAKRHLHAAKEKQAALTHKHPALGIIPIQASSELRLAMRHLRRLLPPIPPPPRATSSENTL